LFSIHRQKREFAVSRIDVNLKCVNIEDRLSGLKIEIPYGTKQLASAKFIEEYELHLIYKNGTEKSVNLLMQGY
jgi:hypothetical protein